MDRRAEVRREESLFPELVRSLAHPYGILPSQSLQDLISSRRLYGEIPVEGDQVQPSSVDLRLGAKAFRVSASFFPTESSTVRSKIERYLVEEISLESPAVLHRDGIYLVPLEEELFLPEEISGKANPKSTTGRLDILTRLLTDYSGRFEYIPEGYRGKLYAEVVPRTFSVKVRRGTRLNQVRFWKGARRIYETDLKRADKEYGLVYDASGNAADARIEERSLRFSVDLAGDDETQIIGYRARKHTPILDLDRVGFYEPRDFWEPVYRSKNRDLVLEREEFYILASRERVKVPPDMAAEMIPYDPEMGEFRIHYAGFFDPGFGYGDTDGTRAVLEVRSHEVPFLLEDGQFVGGLFFEHLTEIPDRLYGRDIGSSYQKQGLALSKHFRPFAA